MEIEDYGLMFSNTNWNDKCPTPENFIQSIYIKNGKVTTKNMAIFWHGELLASILVKSIPNLQCVYVYISKSKYNSFSDEARNQINLTFPSLWDHGKTLSARIGMK